MRIKELSNIENGTTIKDLYGWVDSIRDHGGLTFVDLRDFDSKIQLVFDKESTIDTTLKNEYYIQISGVYSKREDSLVNKKTPFGEYEILIDSLMVINESKTLPFQIEDSIDTDESIRLKYRYLDLRRTEMKHNIVARSKTFKSIRNIMNKLDILEIDTPTLIKSTPEGAKDFLVPSRKSPGSFYALPQSPQMYKQLFMMSGFPNYYQIAKCYRDEDSRKDRQPEFTQLDLEFSNGTPQLVKKHIETIVQHIFDEAFDLKIDLPFKTMTYKEAMTLYGTDKPDLRIKETIKDISEIFANTEINFVEEIINNGGSVLSLHSEINYSRKDIDILDESIKSLGSNGLGWFKILDNEVSGPLAKLLLPEEKDEIIKFGNGILVFQAGDIYEVGKYMDVLRRDLFLNKTEDITSFVWVEDFPYFEVENDVLQPSHHPFTAPKDTSNFKQNPNESIALHYDLVLNGVELGSGSQRINNPDLQKLVLEKWGLSNEDIENRFGWFIEALSYGTPQHAGFAIGIDRLVAEILKQPSIRDVIPFPKTQSGMDPLTDAPSTINEIDLVEYNLRYVTDEQ
ncbi:aspartate--tRNA ligase [Acidimicrobiia bacterium]|nr:aspartate--tRNA ligase [Acidimicrobiia bacterium]MDA7736178.1 aspartate--tRNA ligase [Acidimicrobiaceae bacterium]MDB2532838.1 aspartate--tRNA ligase [Candidatus Actinomarina sp.]MDA8963839.1 aspartate--tRNA ligase [Acidimicrobiia bacterium]MDB0017405.1 aspartate--tRNA ligase [Acidimicrobiia bacterium]